jgi:hypothetical protein
MNGKDEGRRMKVTDPSPLAPLPEGEGSTPHHWRSYE